MFRLHVEKTTDERRPCGPRKGDLPRHGSDAGGGYQEARMAVEILKCSLALMLIYLTGLGESEKYDIRKFYNTTEYIWTTNGTLIDECVTCKFDKVTKLPTEKYVLFTRNYTLDEVRVIMNLMGTFEIVKHQPVPSRMDVTVVTEFYSIEGQNYTAKEPKMSHMEVLLYADAEYKCGVFLNKFRKYTTKPEDGDDYLYTEDEMSCEVRIRSKKRPSQPSLYCLEEFKGYCRVKPYFSVYQDFCWKP